MREPSGVRAFLGVGQVPADLGPTAVTIGVFDGVHRGHQALLGLLAREAAERGLIPGAITFDRHPLEILRPGSQPRLLSTLRRRIALLGEAGMEFVLVLPFTLRLSRMPPEEFAVKVLLETAGARAIVVGENFRFGHRAVGDVHLLEALGRPRGVRVLPVSLHAQAGGEVSSTRVREALARGQVQVAAELLGRPFVLEGHVVQGERRGRALLGIPTANLRVPARLAVPALGIYAGHLEVGGSRLPAVTSVGTNPQFAGTKLSIEAHVLDFDGDLYGRRVALSFEHHLRDEATFPDLDALITQIHADIRLARDLLGVPEPGER